MISTFIRIYTKIKAAHVRLFLKKIFTLLQPQPFTQASTSDNKLLQFCQQEQ